MKDLSEAELIEMEQRARYLLTWEDWTAEKAARDILELIEHLRAVSIEAQKMENAASRI